MPAITVVITTHNLEKYIGRCLEELYFQTFQDFDILIIDDASSDRTIDAIEQYRQKFESRLTAIYLEENKGMPALTRNVALESGCIHGKYVLFLDGDDSIENNMLETLYALATEGADGTADVAICAYDRVDTSTGQPIAVEMQNFPECIMLPPEDDTICFINTSPWNKLWRRNVIEGLKYPDFRVGEEVSFNFRGYVNSRKIVFTDKVLIHYMVRGDSVISNTDESTIWYFAAEMRNLFNGQSGIYKDLVGLLTFVHIGLSMGLRAADNPVINLRVHMKRMREYFKANFGWFRGNRFLRLSSLRKRGFKGVAIWGALITYRMGLFRLVLWVYRTLGLNLKF